jgi:hypothetical protein
VPRCTRLARLPGRWGRYVERNLARGMTREELNVSMFKARTLEPLPSTSCRARAHACTHTNMRTALLNRACTRTHARTHTHNHTHNHTHAHTRTHAHAFTRNIPFARTEMHPCLQAARVKLGSRIAKLKGRTKTNINEVTSRTRNTLKQVAVEPESLHLGPLTPRSS